MIRRDRFFVFLLNGKAKKKNQKQALGSAIGIPREFQKNISSRTPSIGENIKSIVLTLSD